MHVARSLCIYCTDCDFCNAGTAIYVTVYNRYNTYNFGGRKVTFPPPLPKKREEKIMPCSIYFLFLTFI